nr:MAG TPA: hypothetical protein [Caudoviricetes sp.]
MCGRWMWSRWHGWTRIHVQDANCFRYNYT